MKYEIKKDVFNNWISLLRKDKYKQGYANLKIDDDTYCVLGICCLANNIKIDNDHYGEINSLISLPLLTMSFKLNDSREYSFTQFADWLEENCTLI